MNSKPAEPQGAPSTPWICALLPPVLRHPLPHMSVWPLAAHCMYISSGSLPEAAPLLSGPSPAAPQSHPQSPLPSIRQYELVVHTDIDISKVYVGEMGRLKSYENQKP